MAAFDAVNPKNGRNPDGTFAPGNPGGPGRPRCPSLSDAFKRIMAELDPTDPEQRRTLAEAYARKIVDAAMSGDMNAVREVNNRTWGKVPDKVLTGDLQRIDLDWGDVGNEDPADHDAAASPEAARNRIRR